MIDFDAIMIGSSQPKVLADFYKKVFETDPAWEEGDWCAFKFGNGGIAIGPHDKVGAQTPEPARIIINFKASNPREEFDRVKKLGATVIAEPYEMGDDDNKSTMCTLADPDGNYFQICTPWEEA